MGGGREYVVPMIHRVTLHSKFISPVRPLKRLGILRGKFNVEGNSLFLIKTPLTRQQIPIRNGKRQQPPTPSPPPPLSPNRIRLVNRFKGRRSSSLLTLAISPNIHNHPPKHPPDPQEAPLLTTTTTRPTSPPDVFVD